MIKKPKVPKLKRRVSDIPVTVAYPGAVEEAMRITSMRKAFPSLAGTPNGRQLEKIQKSQHFSKNERALATIRVLSGTMQKLTAQERLTALDIIKSTAQGLEPKVIQLKRRNQ